jgi:hypothetical protein
LLSVIRNHCQQCECDEVTTTSFSPTTQTLSSLSTVVVQQHQRTGWKPFINVLPLFSHVSTFPSVPPPSHSALCTPFPSVLLPTISWALGQGIKCLMMSDLAEDRKTTVL